MSDPKESRDKKMVEVPVPIPTEDGRAVAETVVVSVPAVYDPASGEYLLDGEALEIIDRVKARHMGLLQPEEIKELRTQLRMTQHEMAKLLSIGEKTYTRWETARERPSRAMNLLLKSLRRGRLDVAFLQSVSAPDFSWLDLAPASSLCAERCASIYGPVAEEYTVEAANDETVALAA